MPKVSEPTASSAAARSSTAPAAPSRATATRERPWPARAEIGLSRGAIFSYFPSKWALFWRCEADQERVFRLWLEEGFGAVVRLMAEENPDWLGVYFELTRMLRTDPDLRERMGEPDARAERPV